MTYYWKKMYRLWRATLLICSPTNHTSLGKNGTKYGKMLFLKKTDIFSQSKKSCRSVNIKAWLNPNMNTGTHVQYYRRRRKRCQQKLILKMLSRVGRAGTSLTAMRQGASSRPSLIFLTASHTEGEIQLHRYPPPPIHPPPHQVKQSAWLSPSNPV